MAVLNIPEDWRTISVSAYPGFPQISAFRHESRRKAETGKIQLRDTAECQRGFQFPPISAFRHESRRKAETGESQIRTVASRSGKRSKES